MNTSFRLGASVAVAAAALIGGGIAVAANPSPDGKITACVKGMGEYFPASGVCKRGSKTLTWNAAGVQGPAGPTGAAGAPGAPGAPGATGATGPSNAELTSSTIPEGKYTFVGHARVRSAAGATDVICSPLATGVSGYAATTAIVDLPADVDTDVTGVGTMTVGPGGSASLTFDCGPGVSVSDRGFIVTRVGSLSF